MYGTVLKIIWPYVQRYLAKRSAEYLQKRLQRRRQKPQDQQSPEISAAEQVLQAQSAVITESMEYSPPRAGLSSADAIWYTLAGVLLGGALSLILTQIIQQDED